MTSRAGYTLVEVLIAAALLVLAIAGGASMALTLVAQEEMNVRIARVQNHHEQLARLYQLGLSTSECLALAPDEPAVDSSPVFTEPTTPPNPIPIVNQIDGEVVCFVEKVTITITYRPNPPDSWLVDSDTTRSRTIEAYRPSIR